MCMLNSTLSLYIVHLNGSMSFTGVLAAFFAVSAILLRFITGYLSDRMNRRVIIIVGMLIFAAATFLMGVLPGLVLVLIFRFFQGFGYSAAQTTYSALAADEIPDSRTGEGIGYYNTMFSIVSAFATALALAVLGKNQDNFDLLFNVISIIIIVPVFITLFIRYEKVPAYQQHRRDNGTSEEILAKLNKYRGIWKSIDKRAVLPSIIYMFYILVFCIPSMYLTVYASEKGFGNIGLFFTLSALGTILTRLLTNRIADRYNPLAFILPGFAMGIATCLMLAFAAGSTLCIISGFIFGVSYGLIGPVIVTMCVRRCPTYRFGASSATYNLACDVGMGLGGVVWGPAIQFVGYQASFIAGAALCLIVGFASFLAFRKGAGYELRELD